MRETIELIMETEKTAAEIIAASEKQASVVISKNDAVISEKLNSFRAEEQNRYNRAVEQAELTKSEEISKIMTEDPGMKADLEVISDKVLKRILKTVFD